MNCDLLFGYSFFSCLDIFTQRLNSIIVITLIRRNSGHSFLSCCILIRKLTTLLFSERLTFNYFRCVFCRDPWVHGAPGRYNDMKMDCFLYFLRHEPFFSSFKFSPFCTVVSFSFTAREAAQGPKAETATKKPAGRRSDKGRKNEMPEERSISSGSVS